MATFDRLFSETYRTVLRPSEGEPLYLPVSPERPLAEVLFAHGFYSSALHEIAHWCIAGPERRRLVDYGYWYKPDGRNSKEQAEFEAVEAKPQGLEWLMTVASGRPFHVSADNLTGSRGDMERFARRIREEALRYLERPPKRAAMLIRELFAQHGTHDAFVRHWQRVLDEGLLPDH